MGSSKTESRSTKSKSKSRSKSAYEYTSYRIEDLGPKSILVTDAKDYGDVLPAEISCHVQPLLAAIDTLYSLPAATPVAQIVQKIEGSADEARGLVSHAQDVVEITEDTYADEESEQEWQEFWDKDVYGPLQKGRSGKKLARTSNKFWTKTWEQWSEQLEEFQPKSKSLDLPRPDFSIGLRVEPSGTGQVEPESSEPFSAHWTKHKLVNKSALECLEEHSSALLHPRPRTSARLVYPCFIQELKILAVAIDIAANQLAKSMAYALDQQEELRLLAGVPESERMPIFGAASSGHKVELWCAAYVGNEIQIINLEKNFRLTRLTHACAFIAFTRALRSWLLSTYADKIIAWLDLVWGKVTNSVAIGTEDVPMSGGPT